MKKTLSRLLALALTIAMVFSLAACGTTTSDSSDNSADNNQTDNSDVSNVETTDDGNTVVTFKNGFKIGYNQLTTGDFALDSLSGNVKTGIEGTGNEGMCVIAGGDLMQTVTDVENMITSGCDALVLWLPIDALYQTVADMCEEAGVYWVLADKVPTDEEILNTLYSYKYFAGGVAPDNYSYGVALAQYAIDQGYKNAFVLAPGVGDATATPRIEGFKTTFEAAGGTVLAEAHTDDSNEAVTQAEDMYLAYKDQADCILCTGSSTFGTAALQILKKYDDHNLKILTGDLDQTILNSMAEDDYVGVCAGDFWVSGVLASVMAANALNDNMFRDADGNAAVITDVPSFGVPAEQLDLFNKYIVGNDLFSDEELQAMIGISLDDLEDIIHNYSLVARFQAKAEQGIISADELAAAGIN
jgi:ABC-type sugar transport system substrate-binding protein